VLCARNKTVCAYLSFSMSLDELLFLTKDSCLEFVSFGSFALVSVACPFETNKKLRLHAIILFAFARLKYIHTRTHARAQIEHNIFNSFFGRARKTRVDSFLKRRRKRLHLLRKAPSTSQKQRFETRRDKNDEENTSTSSVVLLPPFNDVSDSFPLVSPDRDDGDSSRA
jgi:hypothetical protein